MNPFWPFLGDLTIRSDPNGLLLRATFDIDALGAIDLPFEMPGRLETAVAKRRADFAAGRLLAHLGQEALGRTPEPVEQSEARAPIWPEGISGSISHSANHAIVLMDTCDDMIGIDIERIAEGDALRAISQTVLNDTERQKVGLDPFAMTAAFSAKEALFKALYPKVGAFFGFSAAEIDVIDEGIIALRLCHDLAPGLGANLTFEAEVFREAPGVRTQITAPWPL